MAFAMCALQEAIKMNYVSCMSDWKPTDCIDDCRYERQLIENVNVRQEERWDQWMEKQQHKGGQ